MFFCLVADHGAVDELKAGERRMCLFWVDRLNECDLT